MPPQPETLPDVPSNPSLQIEDRLSHFGQLEIVPPASHVANPAVPQFITGPALVAPLNLPYFCFESFNTLRRYSDPPFAIQSKAEELSFPGPPCTALGRIHLQSQVLLDPALYRRKRPLRRCLTAHINI